MRRLLNLSIILALAIAPTTQVLAISTQYSVTNLGLFYPLAINDPGVIAGYTTVNINGTLTAKAAKWSSGQLTDLSSLGGASRALDINASGQIILSGDHPALYDSTGLHNLPAPAGSTGAFPTAVNASGSIAANAIVSGRTHGYVYTGGVYTLVTGSVNVGSVNAINDNSLLAGVTYNPDATAITCNAQAGAQLIPRTWTTSAQGNAINSAGDVVGDSAGNSSSPAFLYTAQHQLVPLAEYAVPGNIVNTVFATSINDSRVIVGTSGNQSSNNAIRAVEWDASGAVTPLSSLLDTSGQGWAIMTATDVNNNGQIVGTGLYDPDGPGGADAVVYGVLLTPLPEPSSFCLFVIGGALLWRRKH